MLKLNSRDTIEPTSAKIYPNLGYWTYYSVWFALTDINNVTKPANPMLASINYYDTG